MERDRGGRPRHPDILTPAEWRVLEELRKGGTNAEIAVRLGISPDAVKYHISNMLGKLGLEDRHALAAWTPKRRARRLAGPPCPSFGLLFPWPDHPVDGGHPVSGLSGGRGRDPAHRPR